MDIFNDFSPQELREIFRKPTNQWPEEFCNHVNVWFANNLLDMWLDDHNDEEYREEIRSVVEQITYGNTDEGGNKLLAFNETVENDDQKRLF